MNQSSLELKSVSNKFPGRLAYCSILAVISRYFQVKVSLLSSSSMSFFRNTASSYPKQVVNGKLYIGSWSRDI